MRVAVYGSVDWTNYMELVRHMTLFIQEAHDLGYGGITVVHSGRRGAENMITEYVGKTSKFLRQKNFKLKEELFKDRSNIADVNIAESGVEFALIFSTKDRRTFSCKKIMEAYNIPYRLIEST